MWGAKGVTSKTSSGVSSMKCGKWSAIWIFNWEGKPLSEESRVSGLGFVEKSVLAETGWVLVFFKLGVSFLLFLSWVLLALTFTFSLVSTYQFPILPFRDKCSKDHHSSQLKIDMDFAGTKEND